MKNNIMIWTDFKPNNIENFLHNPKSHKISHLFKLTKQACLKHVIFIYVKIRLRPMYFTLIIFTTNLLFHNLRTISITIRAFIWSKLLYHKD